MRHSCSESVSESQSGSVSRGSRRQFGACQSSEISNSETDCDPDSEPDTQRSSASGGRLAGRTIPGLHQNAKAGRMAPVSREEELWGESCWFC